ncbi:uncharacterized protein [Amphiura filiformis]|uniref:uncharacterized protein n=1 Tax=Amphiura filiformis TaxID=82378 RepID=UPI003B2193A7
MIKFVLILTKQGQTRLSHYYMPIELTERPTLEGDVIRRILARAPGQCSFLDYEDYKIVYRRYLALYFIIGIDDDENEVATLELIHLIVETIDKYIPKVTDLDLMYNVEKMHMILDEMIMNGRVVETCKNKILAPIQLMDSQR